MTTVKHTPGPWTISRRGDGAVYVRAVATVAWCSPASCVGFSEAQSIDAEEAYANARLISATPDLLAACERLVRSCPFCNGRGRCEHCEEYGELYAAIAKAKGEKP